MRTTRLAVILLLGAMLLPACAEEMSREDALQVALGVCKEMDWDCRHMDSENRISEYVFKAPVTNDYRQIRITVNKSTGKVTEKSFGKFYPG